MVQVFDRLKKASAKKLISYKTLTNCYEQIREFGVGVYSYCLPKDYPFMSFIRFLMCRLAKLVESAKGLKEIKFSVPDELDKMMSILTLQLTNEK